MVHTRGQSLNTKSPLDDDDDHIFSRSRRIVRLKERPTLTSESEIESDREGNTDRRCYKLRREHKLMQNNNNEDSSLHRFSEALPMNDEEQLTDGHNNAVLRRSSRNRKCSSWLLGGKQLRGYPNMLNGSEAENGEVNGIMRPQERYAMRSNHTLSPYRRSCRFASSSERRVLRKRRKNFSHRSQYDVGRRLRSTRRRFQDSDSNSSVDDMMDNEREKRNLNCETVEESAPSGGMVNGSATSSEELQGDEPHGMHRRKLMLSRIRSTIRTDFRENCDSSEAVRDGEEITCNSTNDQSSFMNNQIESGKPKRIRKPVMRLMYSKPERRNKVISSSSEDEQSGDDNEEDRDGLSRERSRSRRARYSLRKNRKPLIRYALDSFNEMSPRRMKEPRKSRLNSARKHRSRKYRPTHNTDSSSTSTSSSSDEKEFEKRKSKSMKKARNRFLPINFHPDDLADATFRERAKVGSSLADVDPMHVDSSITFDSVGGLGDHIKSLKEMIIFPLIYPEVFQKFSITPPRGVLFYGSPGTGKTLVARALANECSKKEKKVAFFMRKGADCLSKWVGESERQLRILFDQAYQLRPSIIFFDEIDGLAPVRSSRQDQIHSSIVSTLLALMDGLDDRGEIIVIGATNRVDAIDPALRRPGRFDREFSFPLPGVQARRHILEIHTKNWNPKPSCRLLKYLSEQTTGYCGADIKALCTEASLFALRSRYPQIYASERKLLLDLNQIQIKLIHFRHALSKIIPAGQRACITPQRKLDNDIKALLQPCLSALLDLLKNSFPFGSSKNVSLKSVHRPRVLVCGTSGQGQTTYLAPALLHTLENVPTFKLDFPSLFSLASKSPHEACAQTFHEALRNLPSILYVPLMDQWWETVEESVKTTFISLLIECDPSSPLLLVATSETPYTKLPHELKEIFSQFRNEVFTMKDPNEEARRAFFKPLFFTKALRVPKPKPVKKKVVEKLMFAPIPPPRQLNVQEVKKVERVEEATLRELRIFLREICAKLAKNRMFYIFTKPVDLEEVPDYLDVIEKPMDLETMMTKIDEHMYECAEDFLGDIDLICSNALEYNPAKDPEDKLIRHRACSLRDTAYALIKAEMDTDFEEKCQDVRKRRRQRRSNKLDDSSQNQSYIKIEANSNENSGTLSSNIYSGSNSPTRRKKRRRSNWARGMLTKPRSLLRRSADSDCKTEEDPSKESTHDVHSTSVNSETSKKFGHIPDDKCIENGDSYGPHLMNGSLSTSEVETTITPQSKRMKIRSPPSEVATPKREQGCGSSTTKHPSTSVQKENISKRLESTFEICISITKNANVDELHHLYTTLSGLIKKHFRCQSKVILLQEMETEIRKFSPRRRSL